MGVLRSLTRGMAGAAKVVLGGIPAPDPAVDRLEQLQSAVDAAAMAVRAAGDDLELAHFELEEGAADRLAPAEVILQAAEQTLGRCQRQLAAQTTVRQQQATVEAAAQRAEAMAGLAKLVKDREAAGKQIEAALDELAAGVKALAEIDAQVAAVPTSIRGPNFVLGGNSHQHKGYLDIELERRIGGASHSGVMTLAAYIEVGNDLLRRASRQS